MTITARILRTMVLTLVITALAACSPKHVKMQRAVNEECAKAEAVTRQFINALNTEHPDTVSTINIEGLPCVIYIFNQTGLCYWTDNKLAASDVRMEAMGKWFFQSLGNAQALCLWSSAKNFAILTIVPVKHSYPFENQELHNTFYQPFSFLDKTVLLTNTRTDSGHDITDAQGNYLFSLTQASGELKDDTQTFNTRFADSFSYRSLSHDAEKQPRKRTRIFYILSIIFLLCYLGYALYIVIRHSRKHNMRLTDRLQVLFAIVLISSFATIFFFIVSFVRRSYEHRQRNDLTLKTKYIQRSLQDIYYWSTSLNATNTQALNIDLKDLSFTYQSDIHVFDLNGRVIGSSQPDLFNNHILGHNMAPKPYFAEKPTCLLEEKIGDLSYLSAYTEFYNGEYEQLGYIAVPLFISADEVADQVDSLLSRLLPIFLITAMLAIILVMLISRRIARPIHLVSEKLRDIIVGQKNEKIVYQEHDEFRQLVDYYNAMVDQLEQGIKQLAIAERQDAWKTMARQVAHEIKNPLTPMRLTIQQMQRLKTIDPERFAEYFDQSSPLLIEQIDNLSHIATTFSDFAKMPEPQITGVDVAQKVSAAVALFSANAGSVPINYHGPQDGVVVTTDMEQITQVINNLLKNALQALAGQPDPQIIVTLTTATGWATINVIDNGIGVPQDIKDKIFVPNFTTKSTGSGLGLAISKRIVEASGGKIYFHSDGRQTTFTVELPLAHN